MNLSFKELLKENGGHNPFLLLAGTSMYCSTNTNECVYDERARRGWATRVHSHTSIEVSSRSVSSAPHRIPKYSRRHDLVTSFSSLRQMVKPRKNPGVTIVNYYGCEEERIPLKRRPKEEVTRIVKEVDVRECRAPETFNGHMCLVTEEDRQKALRPTKVLPRWCQRERASEGYRLVLDGYNSDVARCEWDAFYESKTRKKKNKDGKTKVRLVEYSQGEEQCHCHHHEVKRERKIQVDKDEVAVTMCEEREHARGAFYGTTETQKICQNAIQQVLKCEKELQQLQFISSSVFPQAKECLTKMRWVHDCLKLFHTHFRDLQAETDEKLQKKTGNHYTVKLTVPGKHELPFPKQLH